MSETRPVKIGFVSLGCPKNQVDSEVMLAALTREGFVLTDREDEAEVLIVNTCGFIDRAKEESIDTIIDLGAFKREGRCRALIATGCLAQRYGDELIKELPELDAVVGLGDFPRIAEICREVLDRAEGRPVPVEPAFWVRQPTFLYGSDTPRVRLGPRHWAYLKIAEGCHRTCAFCIIPKIRGKLQSRPIEDVVVEAQRLEAEGVREINLIAQDMPGYGVDRSGRSELAALVEQLLARTGIPWVRLMYLYPHKFPESVLGLLAAEPRLCRYVDMPLQHIDDGVLRRMNRGGTSREIFSLLGRLRERIPDLVIRTSFIVGFPGEEEKEFERLLAFVERTRFDRVVAFTYSPEEGTSAFPLGDPVPPEVKEQRRARLLELQAVISREKNAARVGSRCRVLVDGVSQETDLLLEARLPGQAPEIDGVVYINDGTAEPGSFVELEITEADTYDLVGRVVSSFVA